MSDTDIHITSDESFEGFRSMSASKIFEGNNRFNISRGAGNSYTNSLKRIYWVSNISDANESLIIHEDSDEYLKLKEMLNIPQIENEDEFDDSVECYKENYSEIQKYCEEIYYNHMIKKHGIQNFVYQIRVLAYQNGLKDGIEQNRKALREALGF